jgi:hypothetical protein
VTVDRQGRVDAVVNIGVGLVLVPSLLSAT